MSCSWQSTKFLRRRKESQAPKMPPGKAGKALFSFRLRQFYQHFSNNLHVGFLFILVSLRKGQAATQHYLLWRREHYLALQPAQHFPGADKLKRVSDSVIYICNIFVSSTHSLSQNLTTSVTADDGCWLTLVSRVLTKWSVIQHKNISS